MKNTLFIIASLAFLSVSANAQTLTVHEWGTFTTLHGSAGGTLSGLYFEEEPLPKFVYHFPRFSPDPMIETEGYMPCSNVTVKMETPVLYFYSSVEKAVQVHVDFAQGAVTQWYPNRSGGEAIPTGSSIDFGNSERVGSIDWKATVLNPITTETLTQQDVTAKWYAPRQTDANLIRNEEGEVEKYLFYRGLGNFPLPVTVSFTNQGWLKIINTSSLDIPYIYIYDHSYNDSASVWASGPLAAGETRIITKSIKYYSDDTSIPEYHDFIDALIGAGLNFRESTALLSTWHEGYFQTTGFKIFWIVPRTMTDAILPLSIIPKPDALERVLVGKTEILTPAFEQELVTYYKANANLDQWKNDRYHLAYMQRVQEILGIASVTNAGTENEISISPNPAVSSFRVFGASDKASVIVRNALGESLISSSAAEINISRLPAGLYFVSVSDGDTHRTLKLIKE